MKIGILTQPLHNNYGGLLQNYALQSVLSSLGHEVLTINIQNKEISLFRKIASIIKRSLLRILGHDIVIRTLPTIKESKIISQNTQQFVKHNIKTTNLISNKVNKKLLVDYYFDAYIVGSDQVWRPCYSPQQSTFFLDFLKDDVTVKKLAYAASFGVSDWEFSDAETKEYGKLLKLFDAVSVREETAVDLCKKYFDVEATHLLDPTMLLNKDIYMKLVKESHVKKSPGNLFTYILDKSSEKDQIIDFVVQKYDLNSFSVMPQRSFNEPDRVDIQDCVFPYVEEWIRGFIDAKYVITDSFHGTVFSILFNKPFISIANKNRGITRFTSLLKLFHLEDRLIFSSKDFNKESLKEIDWERTNAILIHEKEKSMQFLSYNLS